MLVSKLIETPLILDGEMSEADLDREWNAMIERATLTQRMIDGKIDWEYFLDWMAQAGYEPSDLLDAAEQNFEFAVQSGLIVER